MDLPSPLSCFSQGFARPTSSLANKGFKGSKVDAA